MDHNERYKRDFADLVKRHGGPGRIPSDEIHFIGERLRAAHVVEKYGRLDPLLLRDYSIPGTIIVEMCGADASAQAARKRNRKQKREAAEKWCAENVGTTVTPALLAEIAEFSEATARTFIADRPDLFTRVKRGFYLVRDPEAERASA
jgi:hypothetical protein